MQDNTSPEERLLRLIREDQNKFSKKKQQREDNPQASQPQKLTQKVSPQKKIPKISNLTKIKETFSFELINRILLASLLILGIYLLFDSLIINPNIIEERILRLNEAKGATLEVPVEVITKDEPLTFYTQAVESRNLFTAAGPETKPGPASPSFREMVSKLRLQGVVSGDNPQAIIEDTKTKQVYFLSPGEHIGEIRLKQILPGKVKLTYHGQETELSL